jgi:hypothetical protein
MDVGIKYNLNKCSCLLDEQVGVAVTGLPKIRYSNNT